MSKRGFECSEGVTWVGIIVFALTWLITLCGCKSHKVVTEVTRIDTTKTVTDSVAVRTVTTDTAKSDTRATAFEVVQFVDSGGVILIDSMGNVSLQGVKLYKSARAYHRQAVRRAAQQTDSVCSSVIQSNGIKEHCKQEQPEAKADKWYKSIVCPVVTLCCIAALLYLLFLYIKKKT